MATAWAAISRWPARARSARAKPGSRSMARSPIETMPAGRPSWTTGMRRTSCSRRGGRADGVLDALVDRFKVTGSDVHTSLTRGVAAGSRPLGDAPHDDVAVGEDAAHTGPAR